MRPKKPDNQKAVDRNARAYQLFLSILTPYQRRRWMSHGVVFVRGSEGGRWRVYEHAVHRRVGTQVLERQDYRWEGVSWYCNNCGYMEKRRRGHWCEGYCNYLKDMRSDAYHRDEGGYPNWDRVAAVILQLRTDERKFINLDR